MNSKNRAGIFLWLLLIPLAWTFVGHATPVKALTPAAESQAIDSAEIKRLADLAKQEPGLDEATRSQIQILYNQALEQLTLTEQWQAKANEFEALRLKAPELLKTLSTELRQPVTPGPDTTLQALAQQLEAAETELQAAQGELSGLEAEKTRRSERRIALPNLLTEAQTRLETLTRTPETALAASATLAQAQQALKRTRHAGILAELSAYEQELRSYEARGQLLDTRIEVAERRVAMLMESKSNWGAALTARRASAADAAIQEAERQTEQVHPALQPLALEILELTQQKSHLHSGIERLKRRTTEMEEALESIESERKRIEERVAAAGLTNAIGQFLIRRDDYARVLDAVYTAIEEGLSKAGIEIAAEGQEIQVRPPREMPPDTKPPGYLTEDDGRT